MKQIEAKLRGEAQVERENRELRLERARLDAREHRQTILESISTAGSVLGSGFNAFISEREKVATVVGSLTLLAGGIYGAKYGIGTVARLAEARIGKPSLVRDTSRFNVVDAFRHPILVGFEGFFLTYIHRQRRNCSIVHPTHFKGLFCT